MRARPVAVLAAVLLNGCGDQRAADAPEAATPAPAAEAAAESGDSAHLSLEGGGLRIFTEPGGAARPIPFGTARRDAIGMVTRAHGAPTSEAHSEDCNADVAIFPDSLSLFFSNDELVGWSVRNGSTLTTANGVGTGSTRAALDSAFTIEVAKSSLGTEFTAGELAGLLESRRPDARVTDLWSGVTCIAR